MSLDASIDFSKTPVTGPYTTSSEPLQKPKSSESQHGVCCFETQSIKPPLEQNGTLQELFLNAHQGNRCRHPRKFDYRF